MLNERFDPDVSHPLGFPVSLTLATALSLSLDSEWRRMQGSRRLEMLRVRLGFVWFGEARTRRRTVVDTRPYMQFLGLAKKPPQVFILIKLISKN